MVDSLNCEVGAGFLRPYTPDFVGQYLYMDSIAWTLVGFAAAGIFGSRFLFQWLQSEKRKELVVPALFWHLSFWGSVLNLTYALHLDKAPLIAGSIALPIIYGRNLVLLRRGQLKAAALDSEPA